MIDDLISRKQAQEAIFACDDILLNFDKKVCAKALERVPAADISEIRAAIVNYEIYSGVEDDD